VPDQPDLDESFSLYPLEGEDVLRHLLGENGEVINTEDDTPEDEDS